MPDLDFTDIEAKYAIKMPTGYNHVILVDNAPKVDGSKEDKLLAKIRQVFQNIETIKSDGITMPKDSNGISKGLELLT